jgi:hypothetical protein
MGRRFCLRPLGKRVNGENKFPDNGSFSIKHTHQLKILECRIPAKRLRKKTPCWPPRERLDPCRSETSPHLHSPDRESRLGVTLTMRCCLVIISHRTASCATRTSPYRGCLAACPKCVRRRTRYAIFNVSKLTPAGGGGVFSFMSSKALTTRSATTRLRYHFRLAGTIYQGT